MESKGFLDVRKMIEKEEGYILSEGTLKTENLLAYARDFIVRYGIEEGIGIVREIEEMLCDDIGDAEHHELGYLVYRGLIRDDFSDEEYDALNYLWNEDVFELFNAMCPDRYYFGSSYGDGSCVGFFKCED